MWKDKPATTSSSKTLIAFDLFGTLLDTSSISRALEQEGVRDAKQVAHLWRRYQLEYTWRLECMGKYVDFDECTRLSLKHAAPGLDADQRKRVMAAYGHLDTFDDVGSTLEKLAARDVDMLVFTNGTRSMVENAVGGSPSLAPLAQHLLPPVVVDDEELKHYKPSPAAYKYVGQCYGRTPDKIWLVSSNPFDVVGAREAGLNAVWVDRTGEGWKDALGTPSKVVWSFAQLTETLL